MPRPGLASLTGALHEELERWLRAPLGCLLGGAGELRRAMQLVDDVAVGVMLDAVAEGIAPVVEDLAAEEVSADAAVEAVAAPEEVVVRAHYGVQVLHIERRMMHVGRVGLRDGQGVVIDEFRAGMA